MYNPLSVEDQKNLIEKAINNDNVLQVIKEADIYFEKDRNMYVSILKSPNVDRAFNIYTNMDTAAREEFIELIRGE